jgi:hypothetical protein
LASREQEVKAPEQQTTNWHQPGAGAAPQTGPDTPQCGTITSKTVALCRNHDQALMLVLLLMTIIWYMLII